MYFAIKILEENLKILHFKWFYIIFLICSFRKWFHNLVTFWEESWSFPELFGIFVSFFLLFLSYYISIDYTPKEGRDYESVKNIAVIKTTKNPTNTCNHNFFFFFKILLKSFQLNIGKFLCVNILMLMLRKKLINKIINGG